MTPEREARLRAAAADSLEVFQVKTHIRRPGAKPRPKKQEHEESEE